MFDEFDDEAEEIMGAFGIVLNMLSRLFNISFKSPVPDIARRFLNEIKEFKPIHRRKKGRLGNGQE